MRRQRRRDGTSGEGGRGWPLSVMLGALYLIGVLALVAQTRADPDLWGHVRFGQDILASGSIPRTASYSFTADQPWVNHEWLAEVAMAASYKAGTPGLIALLAVVTAVTFLAVALVVRRAGVRGPVAVILLGVAVLGASFQLMTVRPQLFSMVLLPLLLLVLSVAERRGVVLLAVPPLFALWANLHGGWIVGLGVLGVWVAAGAVRGVIAPLQAAGTVTGAAVATLCNPYGHGLWVFLLETVRVGRTDIEEWQAIWESPLHVLPWALSLVVLAYGCARMRGECWRTLPAIALALLSMRVARLEGFFALAAVALAAPGYRDVGRPFRLDRGPTRGELLFAGVLCLAGVGAAAHAASRTATCLPLMTDREFGTPEAEAVLFMSENGLRGGLLSWFDYGQYAIWHLAPGIRVSYDGRRETVYSGQVRQAHQDFYAGDARYARRLGAHYIWVPKSLPVVQPLLEDGWVSVFRGSRSVVLAPAGGVFVQPAPFRGPRCFPGP